MEISIESVESKFDQHLNLPQNNRILFSGKFGTGKSYFLKKYFENREDKYNLFWLSPVNYVVGANQDIFEWIKIDIAKALLKDKSISDAEEKYSKNLLIQTFLYNNSGSIFSRLLTRVANEIGKVKTGQDFLGVFEDDIREYNKKYKELEATAKQDGKSHEKKVIDFVDKSIDVKGSIFEDDVITSILRASIEILKIKSEKENVLVIDDLDRLDPEHIFRILNILSAHNDHFDTNKFGFDKVIVVCDIENIQHIYEYKYGEKVDFDGYIEKFYTYEPHYFTITDSIVSYCENNIVIETLDVDSINTMALLLTQFYINKVLRIRNLKKIIANPQIANHLKLGKKLFEYHPSTKIEQFSEAKAFEIDYDKYGILKVIFMLSNAFGSIDNLQENIQNIIKYSNYPIPERYINNVVNSVAILYNISINNDDIEHIFYNIQKPAYSDSRIVHPRVYFLNQHYYIHYGWSSQNKYKNGDFFIHSRPILDNEHNTMEPNSNRVNMLLESINHIISYIKRNKLFYNVR